MQKLDEKMFDEAGLGSLSDQQKTEILSDLEQVLISKIGLNITAKATPEQLEEYDKLTESNNDEAVFTWLEKSFPDFQEMVDEEIKFIKQALKKMAPNVLKANETGNARLA